LADLETVAPQTLEKVEALVTTVESANTALGELETELGRVMGEMDADWTNLNERVGTFLQSLQEDRAKLATDTQAALQGLAELLEALHRAQGEAEQDVVGMRDGLLAFRERIVAATTMVGEWIEALNGSTQALVERAQAMQTQIETALNATQTEVEGALTTELTTAQTDVEQAAQDLDTTLDNDLTPALEARWADWEQKLAEVEAIVEQAFTDAADHVDKVAEYSLEECEKAHNTAFDQIALLVDDVEAQLVALRDAANQSGTDVTAKKDALETGADETSLALDEMIGALDQVTQLLGNYTFVKL
jgi:hypothetical protein